MKVMVIAEDFTRDQFILKPLVEAMFDHLGKPHADVLICRDPAIKGVSQALKWPIVEKIINRYPQIDLFLLCVDRDGPDSKHKSSLTYLEGESETLFQTSGKALLGEAAIEEVEVWALAGLTLPKAWRWEAIRQEPHPKETFFHPFAKDRGLAQYPAGGYKELGMEAAKNYSRIRQRCPEDVKALEDRVNDWLKK